MVIFGITLNDELSLIVNFYNNGVKGDPRNRLVEMEFDFPINYN